MEYCRYFWVRCQVSLHCHCKGTWRVRIFPIFGFKRRYPHNDGGRVFAKQKSSNQKPATPLNKCMRAGFSGPASAASKRLFVVPTTSSAQKSLPFVRNMRTVCSLGVIRKAHWYTSSLTHIFQIGTGRCADSDNDRITRCQRPVGSTKIQSKCVFNWKLSNF